MHTFVQQPVLRPLYALVIIFLYPGSMVKLRGVHVAFGSCDYQLELLINAVVEVLAGMVTVKVPEQVLSEPKSITAMEKFEKWNGEHEELVARREETHRKHKAEKRHETMKESVRKIEEKNIARAQVAEAQAEVDAEDNAAPETEAAENA